MARSLYIIFFCLLINIISAQNKLSLKDAITILLKNNYDIALSKNDWNIATLNNTKANAGMLPRINLNFSDNLSNNNLFQKFTNGTEIKKDFVLGNNLNAGVVLNWTLFDGYKISATKKRLELIEKQGEANFKNSIDNNISSLIKAYYDIARNQLQYKTIEILIHLINDRLILAKTRFEVGTATKMDYLQTQIELQIQNNNLISQKSIIQNSKIALNQLIGQDINTDFEISDTLNINNKFKDYSKDQNFSNNQQIVSLEYQKLIAEQQINEAKSLTKPQLGFVTGYNLSFSQSQAGFSLFNLTHGLGVGVNANMLIYDWKNTKRQIEVSKLNALSTQIQLNKLNDNLNLSYQKALNDYNSTVLLFNNELNTIKILDELLIIANERFRVNQSANYLEIKEIQKSYEDSKNRQILYLYNAKIAEIELLRVQGKISLENN